MAGHIICFVSFRFVSFRFVSFRFDLFRFVSICFVSFRFVSFRFDLFRFVPFRFCFVSHFTGTLNCDVKQPIQQQQQYLLYIIRITDDGSIPEMRIWSILSIQSYSNGESVLAEVSFFADIYA